MAINPSGPGFNTVGGSYSPGNFDRAVSDVGQPANARNTQNSGSSAEGLGQSLTLSLIIREAAKRAGITSTDGSFNKADVPAISGEIRKDPALFEAFAQVRGGRRPGRRRQSDTDVTLDFDESRRNRRRNGGIDADLGDFGQPELGDDDGLQISQVDGLESYVEAASLSRGTDIASEMLTMYDHDGDGIVTVREALVYLILHAGEKIRFSDFELKNILKVLTSNRNESVSA